MTIRETSVMKSFALFVILLLVGIFIAVKYQGSVAESAHAQTDEVVEQIEQVTPAAPAPKFLTDNVRSSNADKKLILRATPQKEGITSYVFSVADMTGANEHQIYAKNIAAGGSMELPYNAWDPTDTYVFLQENGQGAPHFYVLKASGEPFANGQVYLDVNAVWTQKNIPYAIRTATGWASGTLLIVYTSKEDGTKGPSYWFEIPSTAIIQLAR